MAWTDPKTWSAGELVTAASLNTHVRDNLGDLFDNKDNASTDVVKLPTTQASTAGTAINALSSAGVVFLGPGTWTVDTPIIPRSNLRITGVRGRTTLLSSGVDVFGVPTSLCDGFEVDHLTLDATGGHVFNGVRYTRSHFHHLDVHQRSADKSIISAPTVTLLVSTWWDNNMFRAYGVTRTVPAINVASSGIDLVTETKFRDSQFWQQDSSDDAYFARFVSSHATSMIRNIVFEGIVWERCCGGALYMESANSTKLIDCGAWDMAALSLKANFYHFAKNASNARGCENTMLLGVTRVGDGPDTGIQDLYVDANGVRTIVHGAYAQASGVTWRQDLTTSTLTSVLP